jgi:hypothetical protein
MSYVGYKMLYYVFEKKRANMVKEKPTDVKFSVTYEIELTNFMAKYREMVTVH